MGKVIPLVPEERPAHATLSCSGSKIWLNCTPSARVQAEFANLDTEFSQEGTVAHEFGAAWTQDFLDNTQTSDEAILAKASERTKNPERFVNEAFKQAVQGYIRRNIMAIARARETTPDALILVEQHLDLRRWVPEGFGTGDLVIVADNLCLVRDLKFGKGVKVDVEDNSQLKLYGLGAIAAYSGIYDFDRVRIEIDQPRLNYVDGVEFSVAELVEWADTYVKPRAALAIAGLGDFKAGDHCTWCRARFTCAARAEDLMDSADKLFATPKAEHLSKAEIEALLPKLSGVIKMAQDIQKYAAKEAIEGRATWNGWKLVAGRSNRVVTNQDGLVNDLVVIGGVDKTLLYEPPQVIGLTEMEKLVGKAAFAKIGEPYLMKPDGKPTLVPATDKRDEWVRKNTADELFSADERENNTED